MNITPLEIREILEKELSISPKDSIRIFLKMADKSNANDAIIKPAKKETGRTFFGVPIRRDTTEALYPHPMSLDDFRHSILDENKCFLDNMKILNIGKDKLFIEKWMEVFSNWHDIEQEL